MEVKADGLNSSETVDTPEAGSELCESRFFIGCTEISTYFHTMLLTLLKLSAQQVLSPVLIWLIERKFLTEVKSICEHEKQVRVVKQVMNGPRPHDLFLCRSFKYIS